MDVDAVNEDLLLHLDMRHGFLHQPPDDWVPPALEWMNSQPADPQTYAVSRRH